MKSVNVKDIAIYGFGGLGREVATIIRNINSVSNEWNLIGFFDDGVKVGTLNKNGYVLGGLKDLNAYENELYIVFAIADPQIVSRLFSQIKNNNIRFPNLIAPNVFFFDAATVNFGIGNIITYGCRLSCDISVGNFNLLNGNVSLGHDVSLGNFNVLFPETRLSGNVIIGNSTVFGARSFVYQGVCVGDNVKVVAGSYLLRNAKANSMYLGNPAKRIEV